MDFTRQRAISTALRLMGPGTLEKYMNRLVGPLILILCAQIPALAQIEQGTIAVVYYTPEKVIIAVDSREMLVGDDGRITHRDDECKIAALGDKMAFVAAGLAGYDNSGPKDKLLTWRNSGEAHQAYFDVVARSKDNMNRPIVWSVASRWGELVRSRVEELYEAQPNKVIDNAVKGLLTSAVFSGLNADASIVVLLVQITVGEKGIEVVGPKQITTNTCPPCGIGRSDIFLEFFQKTSERARDEAARWDIRKRQLSKAEFDRLWTIRFVDLTILLYPNPDEVGGIIDALELNRHGVTWIQRKDSCPAN